MTFKKISWGKKLILLVVSLAIGMCLSEYIVRKLKLVPEVMVQAGNIRFVENPKMVYEYVPCTSLGPGMTNKQGFYDVNFKIEKPKNLIRIVMLGDSITQGTYLALENTFSKKLETLLNQKALVTRSPFRYEVMNFSVGGYNLEAEVEVLKEKALLYHPDIVILNLFFNDNEPIPGIDFLFVGNYCKLSEQQQIALLRKYVYNRNSFLRQFERNVLYKSKLYLFLLAQVHNLETDKCDLSKVKSIQGRTLSDMECMFRGFHEIDQLKKQYGFKFLICIHPFLLYGENPNNFNFASIAKSFQFDYFHMIAYYKKEGIPPESLQFKDHPDDKCHPNEFGHSLIAKALLSELKSRGFIDPSL